MQSNFSRETIKKVLIFSLFLFSPILFGFDYLIKWLIEFWLMLVLAAVFAFLLIKYQKEGYKFLFSLFLSFILLCFFGILTFLEAFAGNKTVKKTWTENSYKIEYTIDQGFSGRPLKAYELYYSPLFGILNKKIQVVPVRSNTSNSDCILIFNKAQIQFNKCENTIKKM